MSSFPYAQVVGATSSEGFLVHPRVWVNTVQVVLVVDDVNDEAPVFTRSSYELSLAEHLQVGAVVGHVTAADRDAPPFARFVYKIVDTYDVGADEMFSIDPRSGRIISTASFDREQASESVLLFVHCASALASADLVTATGGSGEYVQGATV